MPTREEIEYAPGQQWSQTASRSSFSELLDQIRNNPDQCIPKPSEGAEASCSERRGGLAIRFDEFSGYRFKSQEGHFHWIQTIKNAGLPPIKPASQVTPKFNPV